MAHSKRNIKNDLKKPAQQTEQIRRDQDYKKDQKNPKGQKDDPSSTDCGCN